MSMGFIFAGGGLDEKAAGRAVGRRPNSALNQLVRSGELAWRPLAEPGVTGVYVKELRWDAATNRAPTILLKFEPGARYPGHVHPGGEEIFVLEGDVRLGKDHLFAGDYLYTAPHNVHAVYSEGGCVVLVSVPEAVEVLRGVRTGALDECAFDAPR